jgi:hypothetical protein
MTNFNITPISFNEIDTTSAVQNMRPITTYVTTGSTDGTSKSDGSKED